MKSIRTVYCFMKKFFVRWFKRNIGVFLAMLGFLSVLAYFPIEPVDPNVIVSIFFVLLFAAMSLINCYLYLSEMGLEAEKMHLEAEKLHFFNIFMKLCQGLFLIFVMCFLYKPYLDFLNPFLFYREIPVILCLAAPLILGGIILTVEATVNCN